MNLLPRSLWLALAVAPVLGACKPTTPPEAKSEASLPPLRVEGSALDLNERPQKTRDPVLDEIYAFCHSTRRAFNERRFDALEAIAAEARQNKSRFDNGAWKTREFYDAMEIGDRDPESLWQEHEKIYQQWMAAKPDSVTARIAYSDYLVSYGFHARGSGYAHTVSEDGFRKLEERVEAARQELQKARDLPEKDPAWWHIMMRVALVQSWDRTACDALLQEAKAYEPLYWSYDTARANYLLPRWHGEPGEWARHADAAALTPGGLGPEAYARVVHYIATYDPIFEADGASWPKLKEGLLLMHERYPRSLETLNLVAFYACMAGDQATAKEAFEKLGQRYFPRKWGRKEKGVENFMAARRWAYTGEK